MIMKKDKVLLLTNSVIDSRIKWKRRLFDCGVGEEHKMKKKIKANGNNS